MAACTAGRFELVCFLMRQPEVDPNYQAQDGHTGRGGPFGQIFKKFHFLTKIRRDFWYF